MKRKKRKTGNLMREEEEWERQHMNNHGKIE